MRALALAFIVLAGDAAAYPRDQLQRVGSALVCHGEEVRRRAASQIRELQGAARKYAGVVDLQQLYDLQADAQEGDAYVSEGRAVLRRSGARRMGCGQKDLTVLLGCLADPTLGRSECGASADWEALCRVTGRSQWVAWFDWKAQHPPP